MRPCDEGGHGDKPKVSRHGMLIKDDRDDEGEETPSGLVVLKPKRYEQKRGSDAKNSGPIVVNSQNEPWPSDVLIGNGSMVRLRSITTAGTVNLKALA